MKFRKLRIAWSITCLIGCAFIVALWHDSYRVLSARLLQTHLWGGIGIESWHGRMGFFSFDVRPDRFDSLPSKWKSHLQRADALNGAQRFAFSRSATSGSIDGIIVPHWLLVLVSIALAALPWIRWRYGLRTMLIITTFLAIALGTFIWATR